MTNLLLLLLLSLLTLTQAAQYTYTERLTTNTTTVHFTFTIQHDSNHQITALLHHFAIAELRLSLRHGRPQPLPPHDAVGGPGAELLVWWHNSNQTRWEELTQALAGLLCASLNRMTPDTVVHPHPSLAFRRRSRGANTRPWFASLPRESVCTENLSPLVRMLPCRHHAGLATLLAPRHLFGGAWHSLSLHATGERIVVAVDAALPPEGSEAVWRPQKECPAATTTSVEDQEERDGSANSPAVSVRRRLSGAGLVTRGIITTLTNADTVDHTVALMELLPAFLRPRLLSHRATLLCGSGDNATAHLAPASPSVLHYSVQSGLLQQLVAVPARCTLHFALQCDLAFLAVEEHPPDAHHGFEVPAAVAWVEEGDEAHRKPLFSQVLLVGGLVGW